MSRRSDFEIKCQSALASSPQTPGPAPAAIRARNPRRGLQVKASGHFQHRKLGNIVVRPIAEDFGQKENVVEDFLRDIFLRGSHSPWSSKNAKALHRQNR